MTRKKNLRKKGLNLTSPNDGASKEKWYFKKSALIVSLIVAGPMALPLLWANPRYSLAAKVLWSVLILAFTVGLGFLTHQLLQYLLGQLAAM